MWTYDDSRAGVRDALRLSRAMTFKSAVADLPLGGGKGVIMIPAGQRLTARRRHDALLDFGDTVESLAGRYITAEDVGTSSRDMTVIAERTAHVSALPRARGGSGDPSPATALGVEAAIRASCERVFGSSSLRGRSLALLGFGHVGSRVAARCARAGAALLVADVDDTKRPAAERLGARWTDTEAVVRAEVDVLVPCALGGVLDDDTIPALRCRVVAGAANNQLAEDVHAELLAARDILWAPDFVVNAGGIINIAVELEGYDPALARRRVRGIADTLHTVYDDARQLGVTPFAAAMKLARGRVAEAERAQAAGGADGASGGAAGVRAAPGANGSAGRGGRRRGGRTLSA